MDRFEVVKVDDRYAIWDNQTGDLHEDSSKYDNEEEAFKRAENLNEGKYGYWTKFC